MPTNARVNVQKDNVTDALSSSVVVPTGEALTIASGGSLTAEAGSIVNIPASGITGLGTMATQNANAVAITGGSITGITDLAVADGGTGTSSLTGYVKGAGTTPLTASSTIPNTDITGLGTMSTQNASSVAITGGSITGITDLAVADGGTGASNAADARVNLGVSTTGTSILYGDGAGSFSNVTIGSGVSFTGGTLSATGTGGTVTTVSVTPANGVSGTVANPTTTPAISLSLGDITPTTVNSVTLSGSATPNLAVTGTSTISGTNTGDQTISITGDVTAAGSQNTLTSTVTKINGQALATLATGILKNTTTTGVPSIAVAADFPTLNQNTTGNAATATNVAVTGVTGLGTGVASFLQTPTSANLSSMVVDETGSGNLVFANSPVLITPHLDTPSVLTLTNATGLPLTTGVTGTLPVANGGTGVTTSTGTGSTVLSASPTFTGTPAAPTAAVGTNTTQIATTEYVQSNRGDKYLTTSNSTNTIDNSNGKVFNCAIDLSYIPTQPVTIVYDVNNHMHGFIVSYNITTGVMVVDIDSHTGTGTYSAWTINIGGLTSVGGALLSANNLSDVASAATSRANLGVTATGQDTTYLYRANNLSDLSSVTTARTNLGLGTMATQNSSSVSISGGTVDNVTLVTPTISSIINTGTLTLPNQTDTLVGRATTDVLTNKTLTSPVMTTPSLGVASATSINKIAITAPVTGATLTIADGATLTASATATVSGTNTGDQTISITGDVTASGSTGVLTSTVTKVNGTSLAGLATGILKNTTGTGVPSIAVSGSDYAPATSGNSILYGNSAGGFSNVTIGSGVDFTGGTLSATGTGGTVTTVSVTTANGVSGTVANPTTTPAISLTLGAITPTSVNSVVMSGSSTPTLAVTGTSSISGSNTGDQTTISGNAGTATALQTARTIGGSSFDGTANVTSFPSPGAIGGTTPSSGAFTSVISLSDTGGYQITAGQLTGGDRMGISGQASGNGTALVFFDNAGTVFRPSIFDASSHSFKIGGVATTSITSTGFQGAIGATTAATGRFTTVTATSTISASNFSGSSSGTNTGDQTTISGNAGTATALQTARTIGGSSFDGTANVTSFPSPGAIGGTTASTGAFTTLTIGPVGSGSYRQLITDNDQSGNRLRFTNTGSGGQSWSIVGGSPGSSNVGLAIYNETGSATVAQFTSAGLTITGTLSATGPSFTLAATGNDSYINFQNSSVTQGQIECYAGDMIYQTQTAGKNHIFRTDSGTIRATITSGGLELNGILSVKGSSSGQIATFRSENANGLYVTYLNGSTAIGDIGSGYQTVSASASDFGVTSRSGKLLLGTNNSTRLTIDTSGNVGIGVTPSAWDTYKSLELPNEGYISSGSTWLEIMLNTYYGSGAYRYKGTGIASHYLQQSGAHIWYNAPSGSAGNAISFTQAMTLDANSNLAVTSSNTNAMIGFNAISDSFTPSGGSATPQYGIARGSGGSNTLGVSGYSGIYFYTGSTQRARIDSGGLAVTGAISSTGAITYGAATDGAFSAIFAGNALNGIQLRDSTDTSGAVFAAFRNGSATTIGSISRVTTTNAVVYNTTSDARLKENFRDFTDSGRLIDALKPRVFDWKNSDENGKNVVGFIAQEINAADPIFAHIGAVSVGDENPDTVTKQWQRSDAALIPILVAELQSLRQRVAVLESK